MGELLAAEAAYVSNVSASYNLLYSFELQICQLVGADHCHA